jgi:saccharopine dehydrogenase (NAD+, L-lysine-forming)
MSRIVVLGGCGIVGTQAVKALVATDDFDEIVIGDINKEKADRYVAEMGDPRLDSAGVDLTDLTMVKEVIKDADIVLNCSGPFYKLGPTVMRAVIESRVDYVDICDDLDATRILLDMDSSAKKAGTSALIGMGSSPGVANLLAKFCATHMLDEVESIDIFHAHGGEPSEGPAVVAHRIHSMTTPIPVYLNGEYTTVDYFGEDGIALRELVDFHQIGSFTCYPYPHPETITLPRHIKCKRVTNLGCVLPPEYYQLTQDIVRVGVVSEDPLEVHGQLVSPRDFAIAYVIKERERLLQETKFGEQRGCLRITVKGVEDGQFRQYNFQMSSVGQSMGEGTGIPAAFGAILMQRGKITEKGVLPPEACVNPLDFLGLMQKYLSLDGMTGEGSPLIIELIDKDGNIEQVEM